MAEVEQPIIKKIYNVEAGHHGGAWKVAYADFVTAMMAFFLLLWLLSSASKGQLEGIAQYFTPTMGIKDSMGIGFSGGQSPTKDGIRKSELSPPGIVIGQVQQGQIPQNPKESMVQSDADGKLFDKAEEAIKQAFESDPSLRDLKDNLIVEQTPEGLKIEVTDSNKKSMFEPGTAKLSFDGKTILAAIYKIIAVMPNLLSITGHTDATPYGVGTAYTNWELSADRANASRRFLIETGMTEKRMGKVVGRADRELLDAKEPKSAKNRRVTLIMLRGSHMSLSDQEQPAPRQLLRAPQPGDTRPLDQKAAPQLAPSKLAPILQPKKLDTRPVGALDPVSQTHPPGTARPTVGTFDIIPAGPKGTADHAKPILLPTPPGGEPTDKRPVGAVKE